MPISATRIPVRKNGDLLPSDRIRCLTHSTPLRAGENSYPLLLREDAAVRRIPACAGESSCRRRGG